MEVYAKKARLLFIPFRNISNLRDESGQFLPGFQTFLSRPLPKEFINFHCHYSRLQKKTVWMNAGRPLDALEKELQWNHIFQNRIEQKMKRMTIASIYKRVTYFKSLQRIICFPYTSVAWGTVGLLDVEGTWIKHLFLTQIQIILI